MRSTDPLSTTGILLINLGTPRSPSVADVRDYLGEFLMDPYVIDSPWLVRKLIVGLFILPFRPKRSAAAYASIWTDEGSPLLVNSEALRAAIAAELDVPVALGMRYGQPSIQDAVGQLSDQGAQRFVIVPLYPQYADSTVTTSIEHAKELLTTNQAVVAAPFYQDEAHIRTWARLITEDTNGEFDHLLMSFHGLPERHITRADPTGQHCLKSADCCAQQSPAHATCYRHQSFRTAERIAAALNLDDSRYSVSFQSRVGRLPWLTPYTDQVLAELPGQGVRHLAVACPAFVVDNLETLEEIGIRGREIFLDAGGESLTLVPCPNADPEWSTGLANYLARYLVA